MLIDMTTSREQRTERWIAVTLVVAVAIVATWEVAAYWSRRRWDPFTESAQRVAGFTPSIPGWQLTTLPAGNDPLMPVILAYRAMQPGQSGGDTVLTRLNHGYNMVDCMRIKHYEVQLIADTRGRADPPVAAASPGGRRLQDGGTTDALRPPAPDLRPPLQLWLLTSDIGDESIWVTSMVTAEGFVPTDRDTRDMAFPRIGTPDDPNWAPHGLTLTSLKHPIVNLKRLLRAKWNNARCDLLTFLRLRQPSYVSRDIYTLVTTDLVPPGPADSLPVRRARARHDALTVHTAMLQSLQRFASATPPASPHADGK